MVGQGQRCKATRLLFRSILSMAPKDSAETTALPATGEVSRSESTTMDDSQSQSQDATRLQDLMRLCSERVRHRPRTISLQESNNHAAHSMLTLSRTSIGAGSGKVSCLPRTTSVWPNCKARQSRSSKDMMTECTYSITWRAHRVCFIWRHEAMVLSTQLLIMR